MKHDRQIKVLTDEIVCLIAAGEVIERPASVVKELIENSIDAGAKIIEVKIINGGLTSISVRDDGHGIRASEIPLLLNRHTTSKISDISDLESIRTLGFRGEALYSIAAVSNLILSTRYHDEEVGTKLSWENGQKKIESIPWPGGTQIESHLLFHNTPARRKFLRAAGAEYSRIAEIVSAYALAYPELSWILSHNGRETLRSSGTGNLDDSVLAVFGADVVRKMVPINWNHGPVQVHGAVSNLDLTRARRTDQTFFINGRLIKDASIAAALERAYFPFLQEGRHPIAVLKIECDTSEVDVNVHPHKREVRFAQPTLITEAVYRSVRNSIKDANPIENFSRVQIDQTTGEVINQAGNQAFVDSEIPKQEEIYWATGNQKARYSSDLPGTPIPQDRPQPQHQKNVQHIYKSFDEIGVAEGLDPKENSLQFANTYIIYNHGKSIYLIDQHNLHERILYEEFSKKESRSSGTSQTLLFPVQVNLSPALAGLVSEHLDDLISMGFVIEEFSEGSGSQSFVIRSVPQELGSFDPSKAISDCLERVRHDESISEPGGFRKAFTINLACKTAIKAGRELTSDEIEFLVRHIEDGTYYTCPHGRPTVIRLDEDWFKKVFKRGG